MTLVVPKSAIATSALDNDAALMIPPVLMNLAKTSVVLEAPPNAPSKSKATTELLAESASCCKSIGGISLCEELEPPMILASTYRNCMI